MTHSPGTNFSRFAVEHIMMQTDRSEIYVVYDRQRYERTGIKYRAILKVSTPRWPHNLTALRIETRILQKLHHPGVVQIFPLGEYEGQMRYRLYGTENTAYFALEYLQYGCLADHLEMIRERPFNELWLIELFYQIVSMVHYLHHREVAHLDLRLENILPRRAPGAHEIPLPVIIDFGSAVQQHTRLPDDNIARHHSKNSAPEMLEALQHGTIVHLDLYACDVWSLGAILYRLLTGQDIGHEVNPLYPAVSAPISQIIKTPLVSLDKLFNWLTNPDPTARLSTGNILEALQDIIVELRPPRISHS